MIPLINQAIKSLGTTASPKEAYKQVKAVCASLQRVAFFPDAEVLTKVEELVQLDAGLHRLKSKTYEAKIHAQLQSIRDRKVLWTAQPLLAPHCKQFYFAGEEKNTDIPLRVPVATLERLIANSSLLQADWEKFKKDEVIHLHQVSRKHFITIVENLCDDNLEPANEEISELYQAATFLGIHRLHTLYLAKLREALSNETWQSLFENICEFCVGSSYDPQQVNEALLAFLEAECRHALNRNFLIQPDVDKLVAAFCEKAQKTTEEFWKLAEVHFPQFVRYLACKSGQLPINPEKPTLPEQVGRVLALQAQGVSIALETPLCSDRVIDAYLHALLQKKIECIPSDPLRRLWLGKTESAPEAFLRQNPRLWLGQHDTFWLNNSPEYYQNQLRDISDLMSENEGLATAELQQRCAARSFLCYLYLGKTEEALATVAQFDYQDLPPGEALPYFIFLMELGIYYNQDIPLKPNWLKHLEALYALEPLAAETPASSAYLTIQDNQKLQKPFSIRPLQFEVSESNPIASLKNHCEANPKHILPKIRLAHLLWKKGEFQEFLKYCEEVLAQQTNTAMLYRRCLFYKKSKQLDLAEKDARDLLGLKFSFKNLNLLMSLIAKQRGTQAALDYLSKHASSCEGKLCLALWKKDTEALEAIKEESNPDYWQTHGILHKNYQSFVNGLRLQPEHLGCLQGIMDWARQVPFAELKCKSPATLWEYSNKYADHHETIHPKYSFIRNYNAIPRMDYGVFNVPLKPKYSWFHLYKAFNQDPVVLARDIEKLAPHLSEEQLALVPVFQAHRKGDLDKVIELANEQSSEDRLLAADAHRQKGNFVKAQALLEGHPDPAAEVIRDAIRLQANPNAIHSNLRILTSYPYAPFVELSYLTAAKNERNKPGTSEVIQTYLNHIWRLRHLTETLVFLQSIRYVNEPNLLAYKKNGYLLNPILEGKLHEQLARDNHYFSMDAGFLANSPAHKGIYAQYLYMNNQFKEAVELLEAPCWIAECYEHLGMPEKACEYYEKASDTTGALCRAEILRKRIAGDKSWLNNEEGIGDYPDACKLFGEGKYSELLIRLEGDLSWQKVTRKGLHVHFLKAQSCFHIGDKDRARAMVKEIMEYSAKALDLYGKAFFEEVMGWSKLHLNTGNKKQKR